MAKHGECLSKIAHQYGISSWKRLWDEPKNEPLRKKRKSSHLLLPGDEVAVPGVTVHEIIRPTDATHRIVVRRSLATFQIVLQDHNQHPFQNEPYELRIPAYPQEPPRIGTTDGDGKVVEKLPVHVQRVNVRLPRPGLSWSFALSQLVATPADKAEQQTQDGKSTLHAVMATQARLNALGFPCGPVDGLLGPRTRDALALYREDDP